MSELGIEVRNLNALEEKGVLTVADALNSCRFRAEDCRDHCVCRELTPGLPPEWQPVCYLGNVPNFGRIALRELESKLAAAGFKTTATEEAEKLNGS